MEAYEAIHRAAQYLAAANKCYATIAPNGDEHGLEWNSDEGSFRSEALNDEGLRLELNLKVYALDVVHPDSGLSASFALTGAKHFDIVNWLENERQFCGLPKPFIFETGYQLLFEPPFAEQFVFPTFSGKDLDMQIQARTMAYDTLHFISSDLGLGTRAKTKAKNMETSLRLKLPQQDQMLVIGLNMGNQHYDDVHFFRAVETLKGIEEYEVMSALAPLDHDSLVSFFQRN